MNKDFRNLIEGYLEEGITDSLKDLGDALIHVGKQHFGEFTNKSSAKRIDIEASNLDSKHLNSFEKNKIIDTIANNKNSDSENLRHAVRYINNSSDFGGGHQNQLDKITNHQNADIHVLDEISKNRNLSPETTKHIAKSTIFHSTGEALKNNYQHFSHNEVISDELTKNKSASSKVLRNIFNDDTLPKPIRKQAIHHANYRSHMLIDDILHSTDNFKRSESGKELLKRVDGKEDKYQIPHEYAGDVNKIALHLAKDFK